MFGKEPGSRAESRSASAPEAALSIISEGVRIIGDIESAGILKVDGVIEGSVRGTRQVLLGKSGTIRGDVSTAEAVIAGTIAGSVVASIRLELQAGGVVNGNIDTKSIIVLEGARINGTVSMADSRKVSDATTDARADALGAGGEIGTLRLAH